jgi:hypothetical protein
MPGYFGVDLGLGKSWKMPYSENHQLQLRWNVFNVTNTQHFGGIDGSGTGFDVDPGLNHTNAPGKLVELHPDSGAVPRNAGGARYSF